MSTFRSQGDRARISMLLSGDATDSIEKLAKQLGVFKYDIVETLVRVVDFDDPYFQQLLEDRIDELPANVQKSLAFKKFREGR